MFVDRRLLHRSVALGFREVRAASADAPVVFHQRRRVYMGVPLDPRGAIPPGADIIRIGPTGAAAPPPPPPIRRKEPNMPPPPNNGHPLNVSRPRDPNVEKWDLEDVIAETEALRTALQDAGARTGRLLASLKHQRRQSRAVRSAMASLRQLQLGP